jgi:hypothetical protein
VNNYPQKSLTDYLRALSVALLPNLVLFLSPILSDEAAPAKAEAPAADAIFFVLCGKIASSIERLKF